MKSRLMSWCRGVVNNRDGATIAFLIALFLVILIGAVLIASVADEVNTATTSAETGTLVDTILDLWPFLFALVPVIIIVKYIG